MKWLKSHKKIALIVLVTVLLGLYFLFGKKNGSIDVQEYSVGKREVIRTISSSGDTKTLDTVVVRSPLTARVKVLSIKSGQEVKKGESILEFDKLSLQSASSTAWQGYLASKATYDSLDEQIKSAEGAVSEKKTIRDTAEREYRGDSSFENKATYKTAETAYLTAESNLQVLKDKKESLKQAVNSTLSAYVVAKDNYDNGVLKAPESGYMAIHDISEGALVTAGQKLFTIVNPSMLEFVAEVDEADVQRIQVNQNVTVSLEGYPDKEFTGKVLLIDAKTHAASSGSTVVDVEIQLNASDIRPIIGMSGTAKIQIGKEDQKLAIPFDAIFSDTEKNYVFVITGDKVYRKEVKIGLEGDEYSVVLEGLNENDKVAVGTNISKLSDGSKISVVKN